jgi:tetratricopeptide (TPR) repeat protein
LTERGLRELRSGQYSEAIATCTDALHANPRDDEAYLYRGRAYHFRNAKGDPRRALADFTKAIELAPESSDAYYYRAQVYRDLGETELASADDKAARANDKGLMQLDRQLPDPPATVIAATLPAAAKPAAGDSTDEESDPYENLPDHLESDFGKLRAGGYNAEDSNESDRASSVAERNRAALPDERAYEPYADDYRSEGPVTGFDPRRMPPLSPPGAAAAQDSTQRRAFRPSPTSPFLPPAPSPANVPGQVPPLASPFGGRTVQSPFGQGAPAPTGFGRPIPGPFSPPAAQTPRSTPGNPYSNPLVRPPNPRDYVP